MRNFKTFLLTAMLLCLEAFGASYVGSFTADNQSAGPLYLRARESMTYSLADFGVATVKLQKSENLQTWETIASHTANVASTVYANTASQPVYVRLYVDAYTSGTIAATLADVDGDILSTVHTHPYQTNREVMQIDDLARGVFPNGIKVDDIAMGDTLTLQAGSAGTGSIFHNVDTGLVQVCGGDDATSGACWKLYGATHATLAGDAVLTNAAGTSIFTHDDSADTIVMSPASLTVGTNAGLGSLTLGQGNAGGSRIFTIRDNGNLQLFASPDATGGYLRLYGPQHATLANDYQINNGSANALYYDHSAGQVNIGVASTGNVVIEGDALGFYGTSAVAKQGAITAAAGDDATAVNAIITALENYGLLVAN